MSNLNLEQLKALTLTAEAAEDMALDYAMCPAGDFEARVDGSKLDQLTFTRNGEQVSLPKLSIRYSILSQDALDAVGRDKVVVTQDIILNLLDDGSIDPNNNQQLTALIRGVWPGQDFNFYDDALAGRFALVRVSHITDKLKEGQSPDEVKTRAKVTLVKKYEG